MTAMSAHSMEVPVAILAGGLATRMRPLTETIPKSLLPVAGRPFLAHQLELLKKRGVRRAVLCLGHLGEQIEHIFGDGRSYGIHLRYSYDGPALLGTGGAIRRALPLLDETFFVLYGDSYLPIDFAAVARAFQQSGQPGLMTVYRNEGRFDTSNVWFEQGQIKDYDKASRREEMRHIDYGLSMFKEDVFSAYREDQPLDLASVMRELVRRGQLAGFEVFERFYEIGSKAGLEELEKLLG